MQLSKELSVSYPTAWYMLHRLRLACGGGMEALQGEVEMDATYIGGKRKNMSNTRRKALRDTGRGTVGKQPVVGMRQRGGLTRAVVVDTENSDTVLGRVHDNVEEGTTIYSDEATAYNVLRKNGYKHKKVNHSAREYVNGTAHTNGIESVWALIKRGYDRVYHNWSKKHCHRYVNEFTFRLNEGDVERDTRERLDSLFQALDAKTITCETLTS